MSAPSIDLAPPKPGIIERLQGNPWIGVVGPPIGIGLFGLLSYWAVTSAELSTVELTILDPTKIWAQLLEHLNITFWSTLVVLVVAIPLGILLTRPRFSRWEEPVLSVANAGQAFPAYGLIIIFFIWLGRGATTAIWALAFYALLPVLRNTIVGIQQVNPAIIEAGRGMGMSKMTALRKIELPLAVPVMMAGVRTALIINVGMATLVFLIGAGGLGVTIKSGLDLNRPIAVFAGAAIVGVVALTIDWAAAMVYRYVRPKGL
ncbi:MAG: ABC transporter permease [Acidimicrobiia bacterium]